MKIVIEEDDSFIQPDNIATMIVVAVTKSDGKIVRFPYSAERSMSALIADINTKIGSAPLSQERIDALPAPLALQIAPSQKSLKELVGIQDGKIHKECLVKCVKLLPRDKDAPIDMVVGGIYRVLELTGRHPYYEIIDDTDYHKADIPRRVAAFPEEIEFFEKRKPPIPKEIGRIEEIFPCDLCGVKIVCHKMDDGKFHGVCGDCNHEIISDRVRQTVMQ